MQSLNVMWPLFKFILGSTTGIWTNTNGLFVTLFSAEANTKWMFGPALISAMVTCHLVLVVLPCFGVIYCFSAGIKSQEIVKSQWIRMVNKVINIAEPYCFIGFWMLWNLILLGCMYRMYVERIAACLKSVTQATYCSWLQNSQLGIYIFIVILHRNVNVREISGVRQLCLPCMC